MPIPQTIRVNPLDLRKNIVIGVSLPFNGPAGPFNSTYSTKEQVKSNLLNLILTNRGERLFNPEFGSDLKKVLFDNITEDLPLEISSRINSSIAYFIPEIQSSQVIVIPDTDTNSISVTVYYILKVSGTQDQITVEFI
jgi:phage baseplate assembly protein W